MRTVIDANVRDRSKEAAREIRRFIEVGISKQTLKPGDRLPTEREIASSNLDLDLVRQTSPRDLMEFRLSLEPSIAELSVVRASGADIEQMQAAVDQSRVAKNLQQFEDCDDALHNAIAASTRNPLFSAFAVIVTEIRNQGDWGALKKKTLTDRMREVHTVEHVDIVDAIRRRDAAAAYAAMRVHLQNVKSMMFKDE